MKTYTVCYSGVYNFDRDTCLVYAGEDYEKALEKYNQPLSDSDFTEASYELSTWANGEIIDQKERTYDGKEYHWINK